GRLPCQTIYRPIDTRMELKRIWTLRGANIWSRCPVFEVEVDLAALPAMTAEQLASVASTIGSAIPSLSERSSGRDLPALLGDVTLELQRLCGSPVKFGAWHPTSDQGVVRVVVEYEVEELGRACLEAARLLCEHAVAGGNTDLAGKLSDLRLLAHEVRLG